MQFTTPAAANGIAIQQFVLSWWTTNSSLTSTSSSATSPLGTTAITASAAGALNTYTMSVTALPGYVPGFATNYSFSAYSVTQYGASTTQPAVGSVLVTTPDMCCLRFGGSPSYRSFSLATGTVGTAGYVTTTGLVTYSGAALPWYGNSAQSRSYCTDLGNVDGRLTYFDPNSGQWFSNITLTDAYGNPSTVGHTNAFQLSGSAKRRQQTSTSPAGTLHTRPGPTSSPAGCCACRSRAASRSPTATSFQRVSSSH